MKKILVLMLAFVMVFAACALTACAKEVTYTGEYKYVNAYGDGSTFYGAAVTVTVKGDKITAVEVAADTATMFNLSANWTVDYTPTGTPTEGKQAWLDNGEAFAQSFVGMTVAEVNAITVTCKETGEPETITGVEYVTGATQSSGRVILAIQNAVKFHGTKTVTGEVTYTAWGTPYGAKVDVTVTNGVVDSVKLYTDEESGYVRTSPSWTAAEGQLGFEATEAAYAEYLNTFVGKTVAEVLAVEATATADGQTVTTEGWNLAGATQSAARIIVAIQNALSK